MRIYIITPILLLLMIISSFSQTDSSKTESDPLKNKPSNLNYLVDSLIKSALVKPESKPSDTIVTSTTTLISINKEKSYLTSKPRWRLVDMGVETGVGIGSGLLGALIGAMFGSMFHTRGDTSQSGNDFTVSAVMVGMGIGHCLGSAIGVINGGNIRNIKGNRALSFIGSIVGETIGIIVLLKNNNIYSGIGLAVLPALLGTILFNASGE